MTDRLGGLERLGRLLDEGKLSRSEYEELKLELLADTSSQITSLSDGPNKEPGSRGPDGAVSEPQPVGSAAPMPPVEHQSASVPTLYKVALGLGAASVFLGGTFGLLAWMTVAVGVWALYSLKAASGRWMAWVALGLGILFSLMNAYLNGHLDDVLAAVASCSEQSIVSSEDVPNPGVPTIGVTIDEFQSAWETCNGNMRNVQSEIGDETAFLPGEYVAWLEAEAGARSTVRVWYYHPSGWVSMVTVRHNSPNDQKEFLRELSLLCRPLIGVGLEEENCVDEVAAGLGALGSLETPGYDGTLVRNGNGWWFQVFNSLQTSITYHWTRDT